MAQSTDLNRYVKLVKRQLICKYSYPEHINLEITDIDRLSFMLGVHPKDRAGQIAEDAGCNSSGATR
jgi:hypothetical protein